MKKNYDAEVTKKSNEWSKKDRTINVDKLPSVMQTQVVEFSQLQTQIYDKAGEQWAMYNKKAKNCATYTVDSKDPECIVVNPGTDAYLGEEYFSRYKNLKAVGTPSTGVNHLDMDYLSSRDIDVKCHSNPLVLEKKVNFNKVYCQLLNKYGKKELNVNIWKI